MPIEVMTIDRGGVVPRLAWFADYCAIFTVRSYCAQLAVRHGALRRAQMLCLPRRRNGFGRALPGLDRRSRAS